MIRVRNVTVWLSLALAGGVALACARCGPGPNIAADESVGSALLAVFADGLFDCDDDAIRAEFNVCPADAPIIGVELDGVIWQEDRFFFGLFRNPLHAPAICYRGRSEELGFSSYQCCYEDDLLVNDPPLAGTFDFANPALSFASFLWHVLLDVIPWRQCQP